MRLLKSAALAMVLVVACSRAQPVFADSSDDAGWHSAGASKGDFKKSGTVHTEFSPKTASWRVKVETTKTDGKFASTFQLTVYVQIDINGHKFWRSVNGGSIRGGGGDSKVLTFDNGLGSDGKPQKFKIEMNGANVKNELTFQDQRPESSEHKKGKKK